MLFPGCRFCGKTLKPKKGKRKRIYCDDRCRQGAHRRDERWRSDPAYRDEQMNVMLFHWNDYPEFIRTHLMEILDKHGPIVATEAHELLRRYDIVVQKLVELRVEQGIKEELAKRDGS